MKIKALKYYLLNERPYIKPLLPKYFMLSDYISGNIQSSERIALEVLESIESVENGVIDEEERSGNYCTALITKDEVTIDNSFTEQTDVYSLSNFKYAVSEWLNYLRDREERIIELDER